MSARQGAAWDSLYIWCLEITEPVLTYRVCLSPLRPLPLRTPCRAWRCPSGSDSWLLGRCVPEQTWPLLSRSHHQSSHGGGGPRARGLFTQSPCRAWLVRFFGISLASGAVSQGLPSILWSLLELVFYFRFSSMDFRLEDSQGTALTLIYETFPCSKAQTPWSRGKQLFRSLL